MITSNYVKQHPELWKFIFYPHHYGWLNDFHSAAMRTEYPFFMWNDVVYSCILGDKADKWQVDKYLDKTPSSPLEDKSKWEQIPTEYSQAVEFKVGDKFLLDGYTCEIVAPKLVLPVFDFYVKEISMRRAPMSYRQNLMQVTVKSVFIKTHGEREETFYLKQSLVPKFGSYNTNEEWYSALLEVVKKNETEIR